MTVVKKTKQCAKDTSGATAIEYGLIAGLVSVAIVGALSALGSSTFGMYETATQVANAVWDAVNNP